MSDSILTKKLGRNDFIHTVHTMSRAVVMARHLGALGPAPANSNPWGMSTEYLPAFKAGGGWGTDGNDKWGDCTCADCSHSLMVVTGLGRGPIIIPTEQQTLDLYSAITGFNPNDPNSDQGADMIQVANYIKNKGYLGHKMDNYGVLDPKNLDSVLWSTQLFGTCKLGINFPSFAMDQFDAGEPWDYTGQVYQIEGGHDVPIFQFQSAKNGPLFYILTWGKLQKMTYSFYKEFVTEAIAPVYGDFVQSNGLTPSGFNLSTLLNDLNNISG